MIHEKDSEGKFSQLRTHTEESLRSQINETEDTSRLSVEEAETLLHELMVHQIELEMQNDELHKAQVTMEELKDKYLTLYDFAPVGYVTLNEKGVILEANLTAARLLGEDRSKLLKMPLSRLVCEEFVDEFHRHIRRVLETQSKQTCEIELARKDGTRFHALLDSMGVPEEPGQLNHCRTIISDITDAKRAEQALRLSEERFRSLVQDSRDSIFITDRSLRFTHVNPAMAERFGLHVSEIIGCTTEEVYGDETGKQIREVDLRVLQGEVIEHEYVVSIKGAEISLSTIRMPFRDTEGNITGVFGISRDVTDRKRSVLERTPIAGAYPSLAMKASLQRARKAAASDIVLLLQGESGSGKDYLARWIHDHSRRAPGPYFAVKLRCHTLGAC